MKWVRSWCFLGLMGLISLTTWGQDVQFSQFYQAPLYLNPAFTGSLQGFRAGINYRNQWPNLPSNYVTYSIFADYHIAEANSSIGLIAKRDEQGSGASPILSNDLGLIYSYAIPLNPNTVIQPALQGTFVQKQLNTNALLFPDQFDNNGPTGAPTQENFPNNNVTYIDISAGLLFLSDNVWAGLSAHHLNRPNQSFLDEESRLPTKFSLHGGYRIEFYDYDFSIIPSFVYQRQGAAQQLHAGVFGVWNPLMAGIWYKGFPIEEYQGLPSNNDAIVFMAGVRIAKLNMEFGYSYDFTISNLSNYGANAHEISLTYSIMGSGNLYCPDIWGASRTGQISRRRRF
ncbi:MAG: type IX secretion system membrane protein PorP/SprF [Bernardetiaceae bacterium]